MSFAPKSVKITGNGPFAAAIASHMIKPAVSASAVPANTIYNVGKVPLAIYSESKLKESVNFSSVGSKLQMVAKKPVTVLQAVTGSHSAVIRGEADEVKEAKEASEAEKAEKSEKIWDIYLPEQIIGYTTTNSVTDVVVGYDIAISLRPNESTFISKKRLIALNKLDPTSTITLVYPHVKLSVFIWNLKEATVGKIYKISQWKLWSTVWSKMHWMLKFLPTMRLHPADIAAYNRFKNHVTAMQNRTKELYSRLQSLVGKKQPMMKITGPAVVLVTH